MEMYKMEKFLQREDSDVSVASNGVHLLKVRKLCSGRAHSSIMSLGLQEHYI